MALFPRFQSARFLRSSTFTGIIWLRLVISHSHAYISATIAALHGRRTSRLACSDQECRCHWLSSPAREDFLVLKDCANHGTSGEDFMTGKRIFTIAVASLSFAAFGSLVAAQETGRHHHHRKPSAQATQDPDNIPTSKDPDPQVRGMLDEMHRSSNGQAVAPAGPKDTSGYVGGRPFFSNNPNDQPK